MSFFRLTIAASVILSASPIALADGPPDSGFVAGASVGLGSGFYENPNIHVDYSGGFVLPTLRFGYVLEWFEVDLQVTYNDFDFGTQAVDLIQLSRGEEELQKGQLRCDLLLKAIPFFSSNSQAFAGVGPVAGSTFHYTRHVDIDAGIDRNGPTVGTLSLGWTALAGYSYWSSKCWRWSVGFQYVSGSTYYEETRTFKGAYLVLGLDYAF